MSVRTKAQKFLTLALALALLLCWVPVLGVPVRAAETEMWLYNGSEYPALPDYDTSFYPYAFITSTGYLYVVSELPILYDWGIYAHANYAWYRNSGYWELGDSGSAIMKMTGDSFVWTNFGAMASNPVPVGGSAITSIDLSLVPTWCYAGSYIIVNPTVSGTGEFDSTCTCVVSGSTSSGTKITDDGSGCFTLDVGSDETATSLVLTVTSIQDTSVSATHTVSIEQLPEPTATTPDTPEGEEPIPTEDNPTEPGDGADDDTNDDSGINEKDEASDQGESGIGDLTEAIPDYSADFMSALQNFTSAMTYNGTDAKLVIPAVTFPALGNAVPSFQMMDEMEVDFGTYVAMMPADILLLVQSLLTIALIIYCFKELYDLISYFLTLRRGGE